MSPSESRFSCGRPLNSVLDFKISEYFHRTYAYYENEVIQNGASYTGKKVRLFFKSIKYYFEKNKPGYVLHLQKFVSKKFKFVWNLKSLYCYSKSLFCYLQSLFVIFERIFFEKYFLPSN